MSKRDVTFAECSWRFASCDRSSSPGVSPPTVSPIRRGVRKETHRTHARIDFFVSAPSRVWPGSLPDVQLWRGYAYRAVSTLDFARGIHSRVRNANVARAEFPLVADALHRSRNGLATIIVATGYRSLPIARRALNFNLANLACRWLTASGERPGSFIIVADHSNLFLLINEMAHK